MKIDQDFSIRQRIRRIFWLGVLNILIIILVAAGGLSFSIITRNQAMGLKVVADRVFLASVDSRLELLEARYHLRGWEAGAPPPKNTVKALNKAKILLEKIVAYPHNKKISQRGREIETTVQTLLKNITTIKSESDARPLLKTMLSLSNALVELVEITENNVGEFQINITRTDFKARMAIITGVVIGLTVVIFLMMFQNSYLKASFRHILYGLQRQSQRISGLSGEIRSSTENVEDGTQVQAGKLKQVELVLSEMTEMVGQNAERATRTSLMASSTGDEASLGAEAMERLSGVIQEIKQATDGTASIIKTIDEIAFQTNLLALNAAVEAARAGDVGKGFAVVAEEVRALAKRSADAAQSTAGLIEGSVNSADQGVNVSREVGTLFENIRSSVSEMGSLVGDVASAANGVSARINSVHESVSEVHQINQGSSDSAQRVSQVSQEMLETTNQLNTVILDLQSGVKENQTDPLLLEKEL